MSTFGQKSSRKILQLIDNKTDIMLAYFMTFTFDEKIRKYDDIQLSKNRLEKSNQKQGLFFHQNL
jgi:hypothetical protein